MIAFGTVFIIFALIGVVTSIYVGADLLFALGQWRRDRLRTKATLEQPRRWL